MHQAPCVADTRGAIMTASTATALQNWTQPDGPGMPLWALVSAVPDAGLVVGGNGRIMAANARCLAVFGYEPGSLVGRPLELLIPDHARRAHAGNMAGFLEHPTARPMGRPLSLRAKRSDGSLVAVDVSLNPISLASGRAVVVSVRDISSLATRASRLLEWSNTRHMNEHGEVLTVTCIGEDVTAERMMQREREQLIQELRRVNAERLELLGRLTCAEEKERRRIAHELHDDAIQSLTGVGLLTASLRVEDGERLKVRRIQEILSGSISGLRRLMFELHPASLGHTGLTAALDKLLADLAGETGVRVRFDAA